MCSSTLMIGRGEKVEEDKEEMRDLGFDVDVVVDWAEEGRKTWTIAYVMATVVDGDDAGRIDFRS